MNDDDLLDALTAAFAPPPADPPAQGLQSLRHAVRARAGRRRGRWAIPAIAGLGAVSMSGVAAAAAGVPLPRVVRQVGRTIGLPVDSPQLLDARRHRSALRAALTNGDLTTARREAADLRAGLADLDQDERGKIGADAEPLLRQADEQTGAHQDDGVQDDGSGTSGARHATPPPAGRGRRDLEQDESPAHGPSTKRPPSGAPAGDGGTETDTGSSPTSVTEPIEGNDSTDGPG